MNRFVLYYLALSVLTGCVSVTPRAQQVQLIPSDSAQLARCKTLGPISAEASGLTQMNPDDVDQQAKNNLRDAAARTWGVGVDTVALTHLDHRTAKSVADGIGYKCH